MNFGVKNADRISSFVVRLKLMVEVQKPTTFFGGGNDYHGLESGLKKLAAAQ